MSEATDVLIIGAGAAGMSAALAAHAAGASVTIVEKGERLGGTAAVSGGIIWAANNPRMQAAGMADSEEDALAYFGSLDHGEMDADVLGAFVREAPQALGFLEEAGALEVSILPGYPDYYLDRPGAKAEGGRALDNELFDFTTLGPWAEKVFSDGVIQRMMLRETPLGGSSGFVDPAELKRRAEADLRGFGQAMVGRLLAACLARGIEPQLGLRAERLLVEEGRVVGAEFSGADGKRSITAARGVILATGGFEWNQSLKKTFLRGPLDMPASPPANTGDGLKLAMSVGAGLGNMTSAWWVPTLSIGGAQWPGGEQRAAPVLIERTLPHSLLVNRAGRRFCNEANNYSSLAGAFHQFDPATYDYPNNPAWLVFDAQYRARYPVGPVMPFDTLPDWVFVGDTLEELAAKIDVDAAQLLQTVERFNAHAESAEDPDFGRGGSAYDHFYGDRSRPGAAATLGPLSQGPFHAVQLKLGALGTNGGARTNASAQVLDVEGEPIPGLYGAGNVIACPTGSVYAGAGGTLGPALTFGCIAGRAAARLANQ
ncbi:MAG: FAD-dependent oxidoreductase [Novosphingobium sp.]|uniref:FAD-dependent oxidoreductase n=1 Tax=Novosphingobium sp. TaxID=1874826 RepID=UPI003019F7F3